MKEIYKKRLLEAASIVARVKPDMFDMSTTGYNYCLSPACVWGHYIRKYPKTDQAPDGTRLSLIDSSMRRFGLADYEARELFSADGCGNAKTPKAAAKYIRNFVKRKEAS